MGAKPRFVRNEVWRDCDRVHTHYLVKRIIRLVSCLYLYMLINNSK